MGDGAVVATIQALAAADFEKSMTSYADHRIWHDVYRPKSPFDNYWWASLRIINPPMAISIMASETSILAS